MAAMALGSGLYRSLGSGVKAEVCRLTGNVRLEVLCPFKKAQEG